MILDATAEYITDGDTVIAVAYVLDEVQDVYHPEQVVTGTAQLMYLGNSITDPIVFDKRMGNSDGSFNFIFSHPPKIKNIQLSVAVTLVGGAEFTRTVVVRLEGCDDIPLTANPEAGSDYRSDLRKKEGL